MVHGFGDDMADRIQRLAKRQGTSPNQTALRLRRKKPGRKDASEGAGTVGSSLDHLIGTWTQAEADELDSALQEFEKVDAAGRKFSDAFPRGRYQRRRVREALGEGPSVVVGTSS